MACSVLIETTVIILMTSIKMLLAEFNLTIVHTNDVHARFDEMSRYGGRCRAGDADAGLCFGGVGRRMTALRQIWNTTDNVLFLDAGDQFQGTLWFYIHRGEAAAHFMNLLSYNAMALGNHEFDNGISGLLPFLKQVDFPVLACNIDATEEPEIAKRIAPYYVFEFQEIRVGVIGFLTADTPELSQTGNLIFLDVVESIKREVTSLRSSGVNILIALGHAGHLSDLDIADNIPDIDVVIGGHTNTFLYTGEGPSNEKPEGPYPIVVEHRPGHKTLVIQNYAFGKYLGKLDVSFDKDGELLSWGGNPWLLDHTVEQDPFMLAEMESWRVEVDDFNTEVVGNSAVFIDGKKLNCRLRECTMGNLIADSQLYRHLATKGDVRPADASIINSGSVRSSLEAGDITLGELNSILPFRNTIDVMELRGRHLWELFEHSVAGYDVQKRSGKFLQVAGLRVLYNISKPDGERVIGICVRTQNNHVTYYEPIESDRIYRVVVTSYLASGGDGYTISKNAIKHELFETLDVDVALDYITHHNPIHPMLEGRITFTAENVTDILWGCDPPLLSAADPHPQFRYTILIMSFALTVCLNYLCDSTGGRVF